MPGPKISAFVVSYNRADTIGTCLRGLRFADELIVVDKASTDESPLIAAAIADHVITVPWTPTVEESRSFALSLCRHDWILFMDDDECLDADAGVTIRTELAAARADIYEFPLRHYILGRHDERAYYWPEHHIRLFRRGSATFRQTVHAGIARHSGRVAQFSPDSGACIYHLSNASVSGWVEKTNRYTDNPDRAGVKLGPDGLAAFAHERIDDWFSRTQDDAVNGYPAAVALLRAIYDLVDGLKAWEANAGANGHDLLRSACEQLDRGRQPEASEITYQRRFD